MDVIFESLRNIKQVTAVAYARFSSNNQREESIDAQLRAINEYCASEGIHIVETYTDEARTGTDDNRDNFQFMIDDVMSGRHKVDYILVHKFNRFARNKIDSAIYKKKLKDRGIRVVSVTQKIEDTPEGELMESIIEAMDEYYSRNLALEVKKGLRENAMKGKFTGGKIPVGYMVDKNGRFDIDEEEAKIVRRIFSERALGETIKQISLNLNTEGIRNKKGKRFDQTQINYMLKNEKYIGVYRYKLGNEEFEFKDGEIIPAIIDKATWDLIHNMMKPKQKRKKGSRVYSLTGKLNCDICGGQFVGAGASRMRNGTLVYYYRCSGRTLGKHDCSSKGLNKEIVEKAIFKEIINHVGDAEFIEDISGQVLNEIKNIVSIPDNVVFAMYNELKEVNAKKERLADLYMDGSFDKAELDRRSAGINKRKYELETAIEKHKNALMTSNIKKEDINKYLTDFFRDFDAHEPSDELKTSLFNAFLQHVNVNNESVEIFMKSDFAKMSMIEGDNDSIAWAIRRLSHTPMKAEMTRERIKSVCE